MLEVPRGESGALPPGARVPVDSVRGRMPSGRGAVEAFASVADHDTPVKTKATLDITNVTNGLSTQGIVLGIFFGFSK